MKKYFFFFVSLLFCISASAQNFDDIYAKLNVSKSGIGFWDRNLKTIEAINAFGQKIDKEGKAMFDKQGNSFLLPRFVGDVLIFESFELDAQDSFNHTIMIDGGGISYENLFSFLCIKLLSEGWRVYYKNLKDNFVMFASPAEITYSITYEEKNLFLAYTGKLMNADNFDPEFIKKQSDVNSAKRLLAGHTFQCEIPENSVPYMMFDAVSGAFGRLKFYMTIEFVDEYVYRYQINSKAALAQRGYLAAQELFNSKDAAKPYRGLYFYNNKNIEAGKTTYTLSANGAYLTDDEGYIYKRIK